MKKSISFDDVEVEIPADVLFPYEAVYEARIKSIFVHDGEKQQQGSGMEFRDYRPYAPGDDFRSIDWNVFQRLGRVFLRLFEEQRDLPVYLAPDISASMFHGEKPRAHAALRCAFALAAIALREHDSVGVFPFADTLHTGLRPGSGKGRLMRVAQTLSRLEPGGQTDFAT